MLTLQQAQGGAGTGHGCLSSVLAELQADQAASGVPAGIPRQRLLELARRLARVQALGGEYARVDFSPEVRRWLASAQGPGREHSPPRV